MIVRGGQTVEHSGYYKGFLGQVWVHQQQVLHQPESPERRYRFLRMVSEPAGVGLHPLNYGSSSSEARISRESLVGS